MKRCAWLLGICLVLSIGPAAAIPAVAQETGESEADAKAKAKEERIAEYLRKKEERRARLEAEQTRKEEEAAAKRTAAALAVSEKPPAPAPSAQPAAVAEDRPRKEKPAPRAKRAAALPRRLNQLHQTLRASAFGQDPTVAPYMDLIARGEASAQQIAAFGNFLGQADRFEEALAYYDLALGLDNRDTSIWLNAGTLQRQAGNYPAAAAAYSEVLRLDPSHAFAHYNLGAVLDELGDYDNALEEYKLALILDPSLGDPAINPQAANNEKLVAVRLMLYKEKAGSLGLPLVNVPNGEVEDEK